MGTSNFGVSNEQDRKSLFCCEAYIQEGGSQTIKKGNVCTNKVISYCKMSYERAKSDMVERNWSGGDHSIENVVMEDLCSEVVLFD